MSLALDYGEQQERLKNNNNNNNLPAKEGMVHVSASCSSLENKKAAVWKRRQEDSELKGTAHGETRREPHRRPRSPEKGRFSPCAIVPGLR